jgi:hypothetical protein
MNRTEEKEQALLVRWSHRVAVRELMPELRWLHHSPNGGKRDAVTGGQMRALGVKPGFPDLILPVPRGTRPGLAIEMKRPDGTGRATTEQREWLDHFDASDWITCICINAVEARAVICDYLGHDPEQCPPLE